MNRDEIIEKKEKILERKITREYQRAYNEISRKAEQYLKKFEEKDKAQKILLDQGKISASDYMEWRKSWVRRSREYDAMLADCSEVLNNASIIASGYVRGEQMDMFALSANWAAYDVCKGVNVNLDFTLYDKNGVMRILRDDPKLLPDMSEKAKKKIKKTDRWNKHHIQSEITQGIIQGKSIPDIAKGLSGAVKMSKNASVRNARTAITGARNAGSEYRYKQANEKYGIDIREQWLATLDGRTRHTHRELDGQIKDLDGYFEIDGEKIRYPADPDADPSLVYNCRCTVVPVVGKYKKNSNEEYLGKKTYNQWVKDKK